MSLQHQELVGLHSKVSLVKSDIKTHTWKRVFLNAIIKVSSISIRFTKHIFNTWITRITGLHCAHLCRLGLKGERLAFDFHGHILRAETWWDWKTLGNISGSDEDYTLVFIGSSLLFLKILPLLLLSSQIFHLASSFLGFWFNYSKPQFIRFFVSVSTHFCHSIYICFHWEKKKLWCPKIRSAQSVQAFCEPTGTQL